VAGILVRKFGLQDNQARWLALSAPTSPLVALARRGHPSESHDLYEAVERIKEANGGSLPLGVKWRMRLTPEERSEQRKRGRGFGFWETFTRQWNAAQMAQEQHRRRQYLTPGGRPNWWAAQRAYDVSKRELEAKAARLLHEWGALRRGRAKGVVQQSKVIISLTSSCE